MTEQQPTQTYRGIIVSVNKRNDGYVVVANIPEISSNPLYPTTIYRVPEDEAQQVEIGQQYNIQLQRQSLRSDREGNKKSGDWPSDWFYGWMGLTTATPATTQKQTAPASASASFDPSPAEQWRADGQETGNSKTNATNLVITHLQLSGGELPTEQWIQDTVACINDVARAIRVDRHAPPADDASEADATEATDNMTTLRDEIKTLVTRMGLTGEWFQNAMPDSDGQNLERWSIAELQTAVKKLRLLETQLNA